MFGDRTSANQAASSDRRQAETKQRILDTTLAMIREKGLDKVSWRAIARAVNYSPSGLYEYFDNKDDIVDALAHEGLDRLDQALHGIDGSSPVERRVLELGQAYIRYAHDNPGYFHLVFSVLPSERRTLKQPPSGAYRRVFQLMQEGIDEGSFRSTPARDAEVMAYGYWGLVHGLASLQLSALRGFEADFDQADQEVIACFVRGLK